MKKWLSIFACLCLAVILTTTVLAEGELTIYVDSPTGQSTTLVLAPETTIGNVKAAIASEFSISLGEGTEWLLYCADLPFEYKDYRELPDDTKTLTECGFQSGYTIHVEKDSWNTAEEPIHLFGLTISGGTGAPDAIGNWVDADFNWSYNYKTIHISKDAQLTISGKSENSAAIIITGSCSITMKDLIMSQDDGSCLCINGGTLTLALEGANTLTSTDGGESTICFGGDGGLIFAADSTGSLTVSNTDGYSSIGYNGWSDASFIMNGGKVDLKSEPGVPALFMQSVTVNNGVLTAESGDASTAAIAATNSFTLGEGMMIAQPIGGKITQGPYTYDGDGDGATSKWAIHLNDVVQQQVQIAPKPDPEAEWQTVANGPWQQGSLSEAFDGVYDGGTVRVLRDITLDATAALEGKTIHLTSVDPNKPCTIYRKQENAANDYFSLLRFTRIVETGKPDIPSIVNMTHLIIDGNNLVTNTNLVSLNGSQLTMGEGAWIRNGISHWDTVGGGMHLFARAHLIMQEGSQITDCQAPRGGAITVQNSNTITIDGGTLARNKALTGKQSNGNLVNGFGGAIAVLGIAGNVDEDGNMVWTNTEGAHIYINSGTIEENTGRLGGAIYINDQSKTEDKGLFIRGGKISNNVSSKRGGAIYADVAKVTVTGGQISGNSAADYAGGIELSPYSELYLSGSPYIFNNTSSYGMDNVYLDGAEDTSPLPAKAITFTGSLSKEAAVGISRWYKPDSTDPEKTVGISDGLYTITATDQERLSSDDTNYGLKLKDDGTVVMYLHTHTPEGWLMDENEHWKECSGCKQRLEIADHVFDNDQDADCNICGFKREISLTYTITFHANGGSGTMAPVSGISGNYKLPECGFTAPDGKQFKCWGETATAAEGQASGKDITVVKDMTLYAIWESKTSGGATPDSGTTGGTTPESGTTGGSTWRPAPSPDKRVESAPTYDPGVTMYAAVALSSALGAAYVMRKH